ncbi:MAG: mannose-1-phosphate guanylyltransferase [Arenicella sp.]
MPTHPHTGYGYIKCGKDIEEGFEADAIVEKPNSDVAENYLSSVDYYWNSGMFLFRASSYLEELKEL